jgi:hypothetical protein
MSCRSFILALNVFDLINLLFFYFGMEMHL